VDVFVAQSEGLPAAEQVVTPAEFFAALLAGRGCGLALATAHATAQLDAEAKAGRDAVNIIRELVQRFQRQGDKALARGPARIHVYACAISL